MLEHDRIEVSKGIDGLHECIICYTTVLFYNINFRFLAEVCNECHDLIQKVINFNDVALVTVKGND